jgi:hypothetical protein
VKSKSFVRVQIAINDLFVENLLRDRSCHNSLGCLFLWKQNVNIKQACNEGSIVLLCETDYEEIKLITLHQIKSD